MTDDDAVYVPPVEILPETVLVSTSIGSHRNRYTVIHEPDPDPAMDGETESDADLTPTCGLDGRYREVNPAVYPCRRLCSRDSCWSYLDVDPVDTVKATYLTTEAQTRRAPAWQSLLAE